MRAHAHEDSGTAAEGVRSAADEAQAQEATPGVGDASSIEPDDGTASGCPTRGVASCAGRRRNARKADTVRCVRREP